VIATRQHLAALVPSGPALVLNLLRWGTDIRTWEELGLPPEGVKATGLKDRELAMAEQLVEDMSTHWKPEDYRDSFKDAVMKLVHKKVEAGDTESVLQPEEEAPDSSSANVIDLTALLQRSLGKGKAPAAKADRVPHGEAKDRAGDSGRSAEARTAPARKKATRSAPAAKRRAA
jgi:DNA end-binding protein Ku